MSDPTWIWKPASPYAKWKPKVGTLAYCPHYGAVVRIIKIIPDSTPVLTKYIGEVLEVRIDVGRHVGTHIEGYKHNYEPYGDMADALYK